jgi:hypothetical protein
MAHTWPIFASNKNSNAPQNAIGLFYARSTVANGPHRARLNISPKARVA